MEREQSGIEKKVRWIIPRALVGGIIGLFAIAAL